MTVVQLLNNLYRKEGEEFVAKLFTEMLNREADPEAMRIFLHALTTGTGKTELIVGLLQCQEAAALYRQTAQIAYYGDAPTVASKIQNLYSLPVQDFVVTSFSEFLCRTLKDSEIDAMAAALYGGMPRVSFLANLINSPDFALLMQCEQAALAKLVLHHIVTQL